MKFSLPDGRILVTDAVDTLIGTFRQQSSCAPEAGGMLLGRVLVDSGHIIIDEATKPDANDKWGRFFFIRSRSSAQRQVQRAWHESSGTRNYLGEWHTHPEQVPIPSCKDRRNWLKISKKARYHQEMLFFIIAGTEQVRIWRLSKGQREPVLLDRLP